MSKKLSAVTAIVITFLTFGSLSVYAQTDNHYDNELYDAVYDICLSDAAAPNTGFNSLIQMGILQSVTDVEVFCGCSADLVVDAYIKTDTEAAFDSAIEQGALQCMQPHIKTFATDLCIQTAADNGVTGITQQCECFGEHLETYTAKDATLFFNNPDKYLDASAHACGLDD